MPKRRGPRERSEITKRVGARVRDLRVERGVTISALARALETSTAQIRLIERGETAATVITLEKLAHALRVPIVALFEGEPTKVESRTDRAYLRLVALLRERDRPDLEAFERVLDVIDRASGRDR